MLPRLLIKGFDTYANSNLIILTKKKHLDNRLDSNHTFKVQPSIMLADILN